MRAPLSRTVPWIVTPLSMRVERSSALLRSSAVRPAARSEQPAPIDSVLSSLIDRSRPPVTSHAPSRAISAPTDSRVADSAVPVRRELA